MIPPGYSVSDLIQVLGQVKAVYDAFFSEYTNSASQLRDLRDDIDQFRTNLNKHGEILGERGLQYEGYEAIHRTLEQCRRFLESYKEVLDKQRRKSIAGAYKTARFAFEQEEINRLRGQISRHESNIMQFSLNLVLQNSLRNQDAIKTTTVTGPVPIPSSNVASAAPATTPLLLGSPLLSGDYSSAPYSSPQHSPSLSGGRTLPPLFESPRTSISSTSHRGRSQPSSPLTIPPTPRSPRSPNGPQSPSTGSAIPGLVLPQAALPYCVAEVLLGNNKKVNLNRKPAGRDFEGGREVAIIDQEGNIKYSHQIKLPRNEPCFPYTWHRRWARSHPPFEVDFTGIPPQAHSVSLKGMPAIKLAPKYIFTERQDFMDFQSEVRGKILSGTFEVRQIRSAASSKVGEATDQHLKIWQDYVTRECSISFYASAAPKPDHVEIPFALLEQQLDGPEATEIVVKFIGVEPKRSRTFSKSVSRSSTSRTTSSSGTTVPDVFSRQNTAVYSSAASVTTINSRNSVISMQSNAGSSATAIPLESLAKQMKYLEIEFSDAKEASKFSKAYNELYRQQIARPLDFFLNWRMNAENRRPESLLSTSPMGTPLMMSPELQPMKSQGSE